ncbi:SIS domain-containing protein, partial [Methylobacterium sp. 174MFSha1.1]
ARLPVEIDVASETRYREPPLEKDGLTIVISQSGETADTLASLRYAKSQGQHTLAVVNVPTSTIAREASAVVPTLAGPEIGVASTKAFSCQLTVLLCLALAAGRARGTLDEAQEKRLVDALIKVPGLMAEALKQEDEIETLSREIAKARDVLYLGRGTAYPMALEGALKLKEISYIHAEGYAAGELKHGPIALIDDAVPVIVIAPARRDLREDGLEHAGGGGPRRQDRADRRRARRRRGWPRHARHPDDAGPRPGRGPNRLRGAGSTSGLPHRCSTWERRRPAAQLGEISHGRVILRLYDIISSIFDDDAGPEESKGLEASDGLG